MTWVSDEAFGWATYHYGRWINLHGYGWVWVPGYIWPPAWVSWRYGDDAYRGDYCGWAPLPPESEVGIDYFDTNSGRGYWGWNFHIGHDCDRTYGIGPGCYNFCPAAYMGDRDSWLHFYSRGDNFSLINHSRNVTNILFHRNRTGRFNRVQSGTSFVAALNVNARTLIEHAELTSASRPGMAGLYGDSLAVYAPRIDPTTVKAVRPALVDRTLVNTRVNHGTNIRSPLDVNSKLRPDAPSLEQVYAMALAQRNAPASARVATPHTKFSSLLTQPLTSLRINTGSTSPFGTGTGQHSGSEADTGSVVPKPTSEPAMWHVATPPNVKSGDLGEAVIPARTTTSDRSMHSFAAGEGSWHYLYRADAPLVHSSVVFLK